MRLLLILLLTFLFSCEDCKTKYNKSSVIKIQSFTGTNPNEIKQIADSIRKYYPNVTVASTIKLPPFAFYAPRGRYKADSLLTYLSSLAKPYETVIGFTSKDISTQYRKVSDWGIMGLAKSPGNSCVVSTFRLHNTKKKNQLFKVAIHELGHTTGLPHCPNLTCFMRDAKGGNHLDEQKAFCEKCKQHLRKRNWKV